MSMAPSSTPPTIWGRVNSSNVMKVLWLCAELGIEPRRIDAGMEFGRVRDPDYLAMNPNARVPTLSEADGFTLWESNSICRYLCRTRAPESPIYPEAPRARADVERWMDWQLATLATGMTPLFWGLVRTPEPERNPKALARALDDASAAWRIVEARLEGREHVCGGLTLADVALGPFLHRWFELPTARPDLPRLRGWYERLRARPAYATHVAGVPMT
ncbi:glutathione S-transferase [Roseomonas sp. NAR14]|uniref:Glutathione S-transferase n=1 Tax=Roseomonas acroporae TaxID=2937791 RepID=A0A9X1YA42_9PROT|nr:glutathione S-transferase [Roseomonas acroporae]MCK8786348.1 glutathione S-transferase [Roseomonas acroporae]